MDSITLFKIFLSFVTGGVFTTITLYGAERYGPRIGGIIAGLPSTTAVGLFFIGFVQSPADASIASTVMPASVAGSLIFVVAYVTLCPKIGYKIALLAASVIWLAISLPLAYYKFEDIYAATLIFAVVWIATFLYMKKIDTKVDMPEKVKYTPPQVLTRAAFAGSVIAVAVSISSLLGPLWGGALAAFPAMFLTTFVILCRQYGCAYSTAFARNTPLGLLGVVPYLWGVHYLYPGYGLAYGTILSYAASFAVMGTAYALTLKKHGLTRRSL
jgi:hypothetical protein